MERENEYGNIEYKLSLCNKKETRLNELTTQMAFRLSEGNGECIYIIGISDSGEFLGINEENFKETLENLKRMSKINNVDYKILSKKEIENGKFISEIYFRTINESKYIDIKVGVAGNVDAGKSSLLGVLINGENDNGRGSARISIFNHNHEIQSGRTSSIAHHILGFDVHGNSIGYDGRKDWSDIVKKSSKIISFYDLAGHEKYLRTTILGLASGYLDLCIIMVGANMGVTRMTREHIFLCVVLNIPFCIVISKIDIVKNRKNILDNTVEDVKKICKLPGIRKVIYKVKNKDDVVLCIKNSDNKSLVPMFMISNVTGEGIEELKYHLNLTNKTKSFNNLKNETKVEYHLDSIFQVNGVGVVLGGHLRSGTVKIGDKLALGPINGNYENYVIRSIHVKKTGVESVKANSYACFNIKKINKNILRRGLVLVSDDEDKISVKRFDAQISVLRSHSTTIKVGYQPVLHVNSIRQAAKICEINDKMSLRNDDSDQILRTGDKARVTFEFKYRGEFIKKGFRILLAEGKVKIVGTVL